ncbi:MAG: TIM44-like domain-containing protein [Propionibacteriaceae bacterium]|jgi:predicted lipid-binding transport protein (Tim44 family)|nr:TIM44-like domain-containing protein [Propionibacteriaceae bacterium]
MKKTLLVISALTLVFFGCLVLFPVSATADAGDFNDYDSGGGWSDSGGGWSDSGGGWGDSGGGYSGGYSGGGGDIGGGFIVMFIIIMVIVLVSTVARANSEPQTLSQAYSSGSAAAGAAALPKVMDNSEAIILTITRHDPKFSSDRFIGWVKEVFFTMQYAWMARDWERIRPFEKEELFKQHEMQIQRYIDSGRINVLERININQAYLHKYVRESEYEYLTVFLAVRMTDYIKAEKSGEILKGSPDVDSHLKYLYTFMRATGVLTDPASSNKSTTNCPNCAAPTKITSAGKCEYCSSIITTGKFDWVLSNIDGVKPHTVIDNTGVIIRGEDRQAS